MHALVIYDSTFGNTARVARAIARGLGEGGRVSVLSAAEAGERLPEPPDLLLVGGPTQRHGLSPTLGAFLDGLPRRSFPGVAAATFDTRYRMAPFLSGSAARRATAGLRRAGCRLLAAPESFFVVREVPPSGEKRRPEAVQLEAGELDRATDWGRRIARTAQ